MNSSNEGDRISELPEGILHHILSFLDLKPAIQTNILSTKWRYVWKTLPFLNFDKFHFRKTKKSNLGFNDFVDKVLNHRDSSSSIQRFHLISYKEGIPESDFDKHFSRWINTAVENSVEDVYLQIIVGDQFKLPQCLFSCKSLTKLELFIHRLKLNLPDSMNLPGLKTMIIRGVQFEGNDDDIPNKIISNCPVLESLVFEGCNFPQPTLVFCAPQLKHLVFRHCDRLRYYNKLDLNKYIVKLNAPNLISFCCEDDMFKDYWLVNLSALVKAEIFIDAEVCEKKGNPILDDEIRKVFVQRMFKILRALHNVEYLTLSAWFIEVVSGAPDLLKSPSIQFSNLRCLTLEIWLSRDCINAITRLLKISPTIESLIIEVNEDIVEKQQIHPFFDKVRLDLAKIEGDWEVGALHHLKFIKILGVRGHLNELQFLEFLLKNCVVLEKVIIKRHWKIELSRGFVQQLLTLPRASSNVEFSVPKNSLGDFEI